MKKNMKKILALLLTASMTLGMTFTVSATEANQQNTEEQQDTESVVSDESAEKQDSGAAEQVVSEEPTEDSEAEAAVTASTIESKPADGTTKDQPFIAGTGGSQNFRIPAMVTLSDGTMWQQQMHVGIQQQMDMDWIQSFPDQKMVVQHGIIHLQTILETTEMFQILIPQHL